MSEPRDHKVRRLHMRSMRRGIKEMDLILSAYAARYLAAMSDDQLSLYDEMLSENDHDLYQWVSGQKVPPPEYGTLVAEITAHVATGSALP